MTPAWVGTYPLPARLGFGPELVPVAAGGRYGGGNSTPGGDGEPGTGFTTRGDQMDHTVTAQGYNGSMSLSADLEWVHIERHGSRRTGHQPVGRQIPVSAITEVELRVAGLLRNGHLRLMTAGSSAEPLLPSQADGDEATIIFTRKQQPEFEAMRDAIMDARNPGR